MERNLVLRSEITHIEPGWSVKVRPLNNFRRKIAGTTSLHESRHAVAAILTGTDVDYASRIPGDNYLGITKLRGFNPIAFVAAHAYGCSGAEYDLWVLKMKGHNIAALASSARAVMRDKEEEVHAAAVTIEENGTATGAEIKEAMYEASNPKVEIDIFGPDGEIRTLVSRVRKGENHTIKIGLGVEKEELKAKEPNMKNNIISMVSRLKIPTEVAESRNRLVLANAA